MKYALVLILTLLPACGKSNSEDPKDLAEKIELTRLKLRATASALELYHLHTGHYPTTQEGGLKALMTQPAGCEKWRGPYLMEDPRDGWNRDMVYRPAAPGASGETTGPPFTLSSNGPDGKEDTPDDMAFRDNL